MPGRFLRERQLLVPRDFIEGVVRWHNRVVGYALVLVTDQYPPFRLSS